MTTFFRLLKTEIDSKGERLASKIDALNNGELVSDVFGVPPSEFKNVPNSPFSYQVAPKLRALFAELSPFANESRHVRHGAGSKNDTRFLRVFWELNPRNVGRSERWSPFAKGGSYSPFYADVYLTILWENDGKEIADYVLAQYPYLKTADWILHLENDYRSPGITFPRRPHRTGSFRALPRDCVFADNGPAILAPQSDLLPLLALVNSRMFRGLVELQMGRGTSGGGQTLTYEIGLVQQTPVPSLEEFPPVLAQLALDAHDLMREFDQTNETSHAFCLTALVQNRQPSLQATYQFIQERNTQGRSRLAEIQYEIDENVARLYAVHKEDFTELDADTSDTADEDTENEEESDEEKTEIGNLKLEIENLLMWCVGCAIGRWDVRFALDSTLLPKLPDPFDPLPRCSPGMLVGTDGLPATPDNIVSEDWLRARPNAITLPDADSLKANNQPLITDHYPLPIAWEGILADDPDHPDDIVRRVRDVLALLWGEHADEIEQEACEILGIESLRDYFRQPKHFFDSHIKRYSKSRRKAPIYWLLQSTKKNYGVWLYYHRITSDTLFRALTRCVEPKINLENIRLNDLRQRVTPELPARERRDLDKAITKQQAFISELTDFANEVKRDAELYLAPDFNDGVIISIAPLHNLVPWKEAEKMWIELVQGKYEWSAMSQKMRDQGLVKHA